MHGNDCLNDLHPNGANRFKQSTVVCCDVLRAVGDNAIGRAACDVRRGSMVGMRDMETL